VQASIDPAPAEKAPADQAPSPPPLLSWAPVGVLAGLALLLLRLEALLAARQRTLVVPTQEEQELLQWSCAGDIPELALQALVVGLLGARMLAGARLRQSRRPAVAVVSLIALASLAGFPLEAPAVRSQLRGEFSIDDLATLAPLALAIVVLLDLATARIAGQRLAARLLSGAGGAVLAGLALLGAAGFLHDNLAEAPVFELDEVAHHVLAKPSSFFEVLEQHHVEEPGLGVLAPDVETKSDSADKPTLVMPPPCRVRFTVPQDSGPLILRTAAGLDSEVRHWLEVNTTRADGEPPPSAEVLATLRVNGRERFRAELVSQASWNKAEFAPGAFVWHHVGGPAGLEVQGGDVIELATSIPDGSTASQIPRNVLRAGFSELLLERRTRVTRTRATPDSPNVVFIVMDTQRADRLTCYGYERPTTPNIDALAARGTLFEHAYSTASWTWPATASLLTGLPSEAHGVVSNDSCTLDLSLTTLAEVLQARGFTTGAFSCNPLIARERYFDQGFEQFDQDLGEFRMSDEVTGDIVRWIRGHAGARFFLYLHLADPHTPHRPHPEELDRLGFERPADFPERGMDLYTFELLRNPDHPIPEEHRQWIVDQYDASVATGDRWLGEIFRSLDDLGLTEKTVIAFTSDHGEELFDHGLLEHGHTLHDELVRVPLILAGPGVRTGRRVQRIVSNRHLAPTLARLGGAELETLDDDRHAFEFLLDEELAEAGPDGRARFHTHRGVWQGQRQQKLFGMREGPWKIIWRPDGELDRSDVELYSIDLDPEEQHERALNEQRLTKKLVDELSADLALQMEWAPEFRVAAGRSTENTLMDIGYMGEDEARESEVRSPTRDGDEQDD